MPWADLGAAMTMVCLLPGVPWATLVPPALAAMEIIDDGSVRTMVFTVLGVEDWKFTHRPIKQLSTH